ncbi:MAG TPA: hypothetical protein PKH80_03110 [Methanofastidiosum sp.]|nr:hypothetical protein [Methanofastidiosum sp.]
MDDNNEVFLRNCGEVLRLALDIETRLEYFIYSYFCENNSKGFMMKDLFLLDLRFDRKVQVFQEICKKEKIDNKKLKVILKDIKKVQHTRNLIAHGDAYSYPDKGIVMQKRTTMTFKKNELIIDTNLMEELKNNHLRSMDGIIEIKKFIENKKQNYEW